MLTLAGCFINSNLTQSKCVLFLPRVNNVDHLGITFNTENFHEKFGTLCIKTCHFEAFKELRFPIEFLGLP